ncbi:MAG: hypothetical protein ACFFEY_09025 [Candidatus Thorarchaeota archaeon]
MKLVKFSEKPESRTLKFLILIGVILCVAVIPVMQYFTALSGFPAQIFSSQLSFNGDLMKSYYAITDIGLYRITVLLDYIFMVGYGAILFSLSILVARRFRKTSILRQISFIIAICGAIAACCDGIENVFILAMLSDPTGFPNYWALLHSVFALIKWILLFTGIAWVLIIGIFSLIRKMDRKNP